MNAKHTPGPWQVVNQTDVFTLTGANRGDGIHADDNDGWQICDCLAGVTYVQGGEMKLPLETQQANARLIAAAPELLAALQIAEDRLVDMESDLREFGVDDSGAEPAILSARAAIAKATGA